MSQQRGFVPKHSGNRDKMLRHELLHMLKGRLSPSVSDAKTYLVRNKSCRAHGEILGCENMTQEHVGVWLHLKWLYKLTTSLFLCLQVFNKRRSGRKKMNLL